MVTAINKMAEAGWVEVEIAPITSTDHGYGGIVSMKVDPAQSLYFWQCVTETVSVKFDETQYKHCHFLGLHNDRKMRTQNTKLGPGNPYEVKHCKDWKRITGIFQHKSGLGLVPDSPDRANIWKRAFCGEIAFVHEPKNESKTERNSRVKPAEESGTSLLKPAEESGTSLLKPAEESGTSLLKPDEESGISLLLRVAQTLKH
jgi:hypothetical protein